MKRRIVGQGVKRDVVAKRFVVEGMGDFPSDMLRYDCCFPVKETQARGIAGWARPAGGARLQPRRIMLEHRGNGQAPTVGRWQSFGWEVVEVLDPNDWAP